MLIMSNRIFLSLALLCLSFTSVHPYGYYEGYETRDHGLRQVRRCSTCPPDCPETLASPWYESPKVYGRPVSIKANNQELQGSSRRSSYSSDQALSRDSPNIYEKPLFRAPNSNVNSRYSSTDEIYNRRAARSDNDSPEGATVPAISSNKDKSFNLARSFDSIESRSIIPYGYPRSSQAASFIPEKYRGIDDFGAMPVGNHRVSKNYENDYKDSVRDENINEETLGSNTPKWNSASFQQRSVPTGEYENLEDTIYQGRLKGIETPAQKRVYVVYRADADRSIGDDDLDRSPVNTSSQQQQQQETIESSAIDAANPMTDSQIEELRRRAIASAASRQNMRDDEFYGNQHHRGIYYNEQERNKEEIYNQRRPYNHELYQRFNAEEAIDRQERRKLYRAGLTSSDLIYTPSMRFNPYALPGDNDYQNIPILSESIPEDIYQDDKRYSTPEMSAWEDEEFSSDVAKNVDGDLKKYTSEEPATVLKEMRDSGREQESTSRKEQKQDRKIQQDFKTMKRETDFENISSSPINYRTHSRSTDSTLTILPRREENEEAKSHEHKSIATLPNIVEKNVERTPMEMNPDLMEDMEIPPIGESEVGLQLNFETPDNSTPTPTN